MFHLTKSVSERMPRCSSVPAIFRFQGWNVVLFIVLRCHCMDFLCIFIPYIFQSYINYFSLVQPLRFKQFTSVAGKCFPLIFKLHCSIDLLNSERFLLHLLSHLLVALYLATMSFAGWLYKVPLFVPVSFINVKETNCGHSHATWVE